MMATKQKAAKPAAKKPTAKKAIAPTSVKKSASTKTQVKAAPKKTAKPSVAIKAKKLVVKPVAKAPTKKTALKKVVKPLAKASVKVPVKKSSKPEAKPAAKKVVAPVKISKSVVPPATKKNATASKPSPQPMAKKTEDNKPAEKAAVKPVAKPAAAKNPKDIKVIPAKPVVIPKTNTKTARTYQPDFTKSVLDQPKNDPGASIVRYSDSDLNEFRELIQRKLGAAKKELSYLQGLITRKDEMGGDEGDNRYMTMEDGSLSMEREQLSQMASRQITFIDHLEKALMRIENKTYGICRVTGKLIDKARLRAVPHATLSIEAKMGQR
jgi:RNA polymerase-binding transcription factor DksA